MNPAPLRIGRYVLEEYLGGGMSRVYRARDTQIGGIVAIKVLTDEASRDPEAKERFLTEARIARNVAHENIISIYDFGEDEQGRPFMVMEFLRGEDLNRAIRNGHTGDVPLKLRIALQIARALDHIHRLKIIHRDIKPDNVHITATGTVKLMDFGISKEEDFSRTRTGFVLGTPHYMAPEQLQGKKPNAQVDVFSFGVLLYELFTGERPFTGENVQALFHSILNAPPDLEKLRQSGAPSAICDLVARCTMKDPAARPAGFGPIVAELEAPAAPAAVASPPPVASPAPVARKILLPELPFAIRMPAVPPWLRRRAVPAAGVLVLLLGVMLYLVLRPHGKPAAKVAAAAAKQLPATLATDTGDMVLVPSGEFLHGEKKERASLAAFYIDRTEVTNAMYSRFCQSTGHAQPPNLRRTAPELPVVNVSFNDARAFAAWTGKRLPTAIEWEKAARGSDGRNYPWGNQQDRTRANVCKAKVEECESGHGWPKIMPADSLPEGRSPWGAVQMVGNVWEFVDEPAKPTPGMLGMFPKLKPPPRADEPWYRIRGQSLAEPLQDNVLWDSLEVPARLKGDVIGFRCVKDAR